ncbi:MAG: hypothetical protein RLZZ301_1005 [Bacteroidota bacterium]|jgi:hypothetical protein
MNCKIHIYLLNSLFSQELADSKHEGNESADNLRYEWEDELEITSEVSEICEVLNGTYTLAGIDENEANFSFEIPNMHLVEIRSEAHEPIFVGASSSIVDSCVCTQQESGYRIEIFLKDYEPMANPVPGIFIASKAFPKALIR